jgi:hypothetical protein
MLASRVNQSLPTPFAKQPRTKVVLVLFLDCLTNDEGTGRLFRNVGNQLPNLRCVTTQKGDYLILTATDLSPYSFLLLTLNT